MYRLFASLLFAIMLNHPAWGGEAEDRAQLQALLLDFLATVDQENTHQRFWADDLIYTSSSGSRHGKARIMAGFVDAATEASPGPRYGAEDITIRLLGDNAVVTFMLTATTADGDSSAYYNTGVFRRSADSWQAFIWQATRTDDRP